MLIRRMISVLGSQETQLLELSPGLNVLQAPSETGKSAWCAFLLAMLYGVNSRERDCEVCLADRNRCALWTSSAMSGRLDCLSGGRELTLLRATREGGPPMGEFRAIYGGTTDPVPDLTGANCGRRLLGVSREGFLQNVLIRPEFARPELADRLFVLTAPNRTDPLCPESAEILHQELAFRCWNKAGRLPTLEAELQETTALLATQEALSSRLESQAPQQEALAEQAAVLEAELAVLDQREAHRQQRAYRLAEEEAEAAEERAASMRLRLEQQGVPETGTVSRLRGAIVNLNTTRKAGEQARIQRDRAADALLEAETRLNESPFSDMTPEEAQAKPLHLRPKPQFPHWGLPVILLLGVVLGALVFLLQKALLPAAGAGCLASALTGLALALSSRRKQAFWEQQAEEKRARRAADLAEWESLRKAAAAARAENASRSSAWDSLQNTILATEHGILEEIRRFAPGVTDIPSADAALRAAAILRKELSEAETAAREARVRCGLMPPPQPEALPAPPSAPAGTPAVYRSRDEVVRELEEVRTAQASLQAEAGRLTERLQSMGDPAFLRAKAGNLADQIAALEKAYAALSQALSALEEQDLPSPLLGQRTAELFAELACGAYAGTVPDHPPSLPEDPVEAGWLPASAAELLGLALRLAVRQLVLPEGEKAPLILDDALASFDGDTRRSALQWFRQAAEERQILLFTCRQETELAGPAVTVQQL